MLSLLDTFLPTVQMEILWRDDKSMQVKLALSQCKTHHRNARSDENNEAPKEHC